MTIRNGRLQPGRLGFYDHGHGAGIHNHGIVELKNVTINGNTVDNTGSSNTWGGGGITNGCGRAPTPGRATCALHAHGDMTLTNVTISGNRVIGAGKGGGIENGATLRLTNVTIADNAAPAGNGGGISNNNATDGITSLRNTIVASSTSGGNCLGTFNSLGYNISSDSSCAFGAAGDRNSSDPRLGPLGDYGGSTPTHPLLGGPAIDGGTSASAPPSDQRGVDRQDGNLNGAISYDIGAYELEPVDIRLSFMSGDSNPVRAGDSQIYRIDVRNGGPSIATGVTLIDTLPADVTLNNYAETRGGSCVHAGVTVSCSLNSLKPNFVWTIYLYVTVKPTASGTISNHAVAGAAGADTNTANDQASVDTSVTPLLGVYMPLVRR